MSAIIKDKGGAAILHRQVQRLEGEIMAAHERIAILRTRCKHHRTEKTPRGDTGNYDRSQDRFWYDCHCPTCGKRWQEDQ